MWTQTCRLVGGALFAIESSLVLLLPLSQLDAAEAVAEVPPFLKTYCISCHGEKKQKGDQ